jgi:hemerythrin-like domain-containing protein
MNPVGTRLSQDHRELAALLENLSQAADASNREALTATWAELESRLIRHMQAEERFLLPLIEASHPAEVQRTLLEHTRIRDLISELGVAIELHTVRRSDIQSLIDLLRAHSEREDEQLYGLAGDKASGAVEHSILTTLKAVVRSALRSAS